jgi:hypothetical protein
MIRILNRFKKSDKTQSFLHRQEHSWFFDSIGVAEAFDKLYKSTSNHRYVRDFLNKTVFTASNGQYASAVKADVNLVIIYPELTYLMKNGDINQAIGILFHEIGHLILKHQEREITNDQAQVEADLFSLELGYGNYLLEFLKNQRRSEQVEKRIHALRKVLKTANSYSLQG